jgi:hypothetical protein
MFALDIARFAPKMLSCMKQRYWATKGWFGMKYVKALCRLAVVVFATWSAVGLATAAGPVSGASVPAPTSIHQDDELLPSLLTPVKHNLCGRGMSGRCTKGRGACSRGTPEQCSAWTKWSKACTECASAFAACRQRVGHRSSASCDVCVAKHDACEAKLRK